jgi:hypothetical protein
MNSLSKEEKLFLHLNNNFIGLNPTGQMMLLPDGTFKMMGNINPVYNLSELNKKNITQSSENKVVSPSSSVVIKETYMNMNMNTNFNYFEIILYLFFIFVILYLIVYKKKK